MYLLQPRLHPRHRLLRIQTMQHRGSNQSVPLRTLLPKPRTKSPPTESAAFTKGFCGDFTPTAIIEAALASATGGATPKSSDAAESPTSAANSGKPTQTPAGGAGAMNQPAVVIAGLMAVVGAFAV